MSCACARVSRLRDAIFKIIERLNARVVFSVVRRVERLMQSASDLRFAKLDDASERRETVEFVALVQSG